MTRKYRLAIILVIAALLLVVGSVSAHGSVKVGAYTLEIGFKNEPAYQGYPNSLDLLVHETATDKPVTGLENTLKAEVIFGASHKTLAIQPVDGVDGEYEAAIIPTQLGDYTWHISGAIGGTPVDVSMTSSPSTFSSVVSLNDDAFPNRGRSAATTLVGDLQRARETALIALVVAAVGVLLGIMSLALALRRKG